MPYKNPKSDIQKESHKKNHKKALNPKNLWFKTTERDNWQF
jgi:hypothetical protein